MRALPTGIAFLVAVSLVALAAVLGYRTGQDDQGGWLQELSGDLKERGTATAEAFRDRTSEAVARQVRWLHPSVDASGAPLFWVIVEGDAARAEVAELCARVVRFLTEERGVDFSGGHTEVVYTTRGEMLRRYDSTP